MKQVLIGNMYVLGRGDYGFARGNNNKQETDDMPYHISRIDHINSNHKMSARFIEINWEKTLSNKDFDLDGLLDSKKKELVRLKKGINISIGDSYKDLLEADAIDGIPDEYILFVEEMVEILKEAGEGSSTKDVVEIKSEGKEKLNLESAKVLIESGKTLEELQESYEIHHKTLPKIEEYIINK